MQEKVNFCMHLYKQALGKGNGEGDFLWGLLQIWTETELSQWSLHHKIHQC